MADLDMRSPGPDEIEAFLGPACFGFGMDGTAEEIAFEGGVLEPERCVGLLEDGRWIASSGSFTFDLTVPGGATVPMAGVTMVAVLPTHRRRGILRRMMTWLISDAVRRGEPVAGLTASESSIYGRFGFGRAAMAASLHIDTDRAGFVVDPAGPWRRRLVDVHTDTGPFAQAWERCRLVRPGGLSRNDRWWSRVAMDPSFNRRGASVLRGAVVEDPEGPCGFAVWRIAASDEGGNFTSTARVEELCGTTPEVEAVLWRFVFDLDLVRKVEAYPRPVDDPLSWRLVEPRQARTTQLADWLWMRVIDVPAALSARAYGVDGSLVLSVGPDGSTADHPGRSEGTFRLVSSGGEATCEPADGASVDLALRGSDLGAFYLGGVAPSTLAGAGRLEERTPGSLALADAMFVAHPAPFCGLMF